MADYLHASPDGDKEKVTTYFTVSGGLAATALPAGISVDAYEFQGRGSEDEEWKKIFGDSYIEGSVGLKTRAIEELLPDAIADKFFSELPPSFETNASLNVISSDLNLFRAELPRKWVEALVASTDSDRWEVLASKIKELIFTGITNMQDQAVLGINHIKDLASSAGKNIKDLVFAGSPFQMDVEEITQADGKVAVPAPPSVPPNVPTPENVQDLGGNPPTAPEPGSGPEHVNVVLKDLPPPPPVPAPPSVPPPSTEESAPEPPASDTVQDLGGEKPSGNAATEDEKLAFTDLPPPPDVPPPPPPSFSPDEIQDLKGDEPTNPDRELAEDRAPAPPASETVQALGGNESTVPDMESSPPPVLDDMLLT